MVFMVVKTDGGLVFACVGSSVRPCGNTRSRFAGIRSNFVRNRCRVSPKETVEQKRPLSRIPSVTMTA